MDDKFFRVLEETEEKEFRKWTRDNEEEVREAERTGRIAIFHPAVRDEWERMKKETL